MTNQAIANTISPTAVAGSQVGLGFLAAAAVCGRSSAGGV
jgi:hypothetical protein